jgi:hypothetical protein
MATRRRPAPQDDDILTIDPLDGAVFSDAVAVAESLAETLQALAGYDQGSIKAVLFRKPTNGLGAFEWIEEVSPPFDMTAIMQSLKDRYNGGKYRMQIFAGGKTRKNIEFAIANDPNAMVKTSTGGGAADMATMFQMMMTMQMEAGRESRAASDRMMQMMMQSSQQMTTVLVTAMGGREKAADFIPLLAAMRSEPSPGSNMKETVETLVALKGLLPNGDGGGGFDADDIAGSVMRLAGPVAGALGKAFERRGQAQPQVNGHAEAPAPLALSFDAPAGNRVDDTGALPGPALDPVLQLIRPDVAYYFARRNVYSAEEAAGAVYDVLTAAGVSEDQFNELAAAFTLSADWKSDLAAQGIDLRGDPAWADAFLAALVAVHTADDAERDQDHPGGEPGDAGDAGGNGPAGAGGVAGDDGARPFGQAHDTRLPERSGA